MVKVFSKRTEVQNEAAYCFVYTKLPDDDSLSKFKHNLLDQRHLPAKNKRTLADHVPDKKFVGCGHLTDNHHGLQIRPWQGSVSSVKRKKPPNMKAS